jgi:hypothetical protein
MMELQALIVVLSPHSRVRQLPRHMAISIQPFDPSRSSAIADLNRRMAAGGSTWQFPEHPDPGSFAREAGSPVFQELFVAVDGAAVRGGYTLQHRPAAFGSDERLIGTWYQPISEGSVDPKHSLVAIQLLRDALRREPLCFGLGLEGPDSQLAKLATTLRCELRLIPFFVRVQNGQRFARHARYLRKRRVLGRLLDLAAATRTAGLAVTLANAALQRVPRPGADTRVESITGFGPWADEVWARSRARYSFVGVRDAATLRRLYPERQRFRGVRVLRGETTLGWAVLDSKRMSDDRKFGDLHIGRVADCFGAPEDADVVVRAAVDVLAEEGVDVILSNMSHPAWCAALRRNAFLPAPSNFVFAPSPELAKRIRAIDPEARDVHLTRGDDGGGPLTRAAFSARRVRKARAAPREDERASA